MAPENSAGIQWFRKMDKKKIEKDKNAIDAIQLQMKDVSFKITKKIIQINFRKFAPSPGTGKATILPP